jgi:hypothetical protein
MVISIDAGNLCPIKEAICNDVAPEANHPRRR